ncbi:hypothetical protein AB0M28_20230 [Streptomyces sp. NPDC051940]|uniref:hypothetical protein n=1 Tax=Streptomyces sp. NPDC051940 TaxID=3155675 RepID=UPI00341FAAA9
MPKIRAASVSDHRAQQRAALLEAARDVLIEGDASAVTFAEVARRTAWPETASTSTSPTATNC